MTGRRRSCGEYMSRSGSGSSVRIWLSVLQRKNGKGTIFFLIHCEAFPIILSEKHKKYKKKKPKATLHIFVKLNKLGNDKVRMWLSAQRRLLMGTRDSALLTGNTAADRRRLFRITPSPFYLWDRIPYQLSRRLGGPQGRSGRFGEQKNLLFLQGL